MKEGRLNRSHTVGFHSQDNLRKTKLQGWRPDQWLPGVGDREEGATTKEQQGGGFGGDGTVWYPDNESAYTNMYTF